MASLSELFQGMRMLQDNVQGMALDRAMRDANDQVYQIRNSEAKDAEKIQGYRNVAQDFTLRMAGMGANPQQIKTVSESIAPPAPTTTVAAELSGVPYYQGLGAKIDQREFAQKKDILGVMSGAKIRKEYDQQLGKAQEGYTKISQKLNDSLKYSSNIEQILNKPAGQRNPLEIGEALTQMPRAAGEVGRIPMQEREYFAGSMKVSDQIDQYLKKYGESSFSDVNRAGLLNLIQVYKQTAQDEKNKYAKLVTGQLKSRSLFMDQSHESILHSITNGEVNPQDIYGGAAQQGPTAGSYSAPGQPTPAGTAAPAPWQKYF